ncbi:MAG: hypothetical protein IPG89_07855 [Bacteroidetes bacterium]|nr:hypothetical protein [Bacteroidota bacterium]
MKTRKTIFFLLSFIFFLQIKAQVLEVTKSVNTNFAAEATPLAGNFVGTSIAIIEGVDFPVGYKICDISISVTWSKTQGSCIAPTAGAVNLSEVGFAMQFSGGSPSTQFFAASGSLAGFFGTTSSWSGSNQVLGVTTTFNQSGQTLLPASQPINGTFAPNNQPLTGVPNDPNNWSGG